MAASVFATAFVLLYVGHMLADYPFQTDHQAAHKAGSGRVGWTASAAHAGTHAVVAVALVLGVGAAALGLHLTGAGTVAAVAWIVVSHAAIDRRWPVTRWMAVARQTGFAAHGGAAHVDQTAHLALGLLPAALMLALI
ncbi:DUF3307 domain-containing protein [Kitasatospora sp. NBC_00315]|uniref:DUF3307 domain-containing protein n=1 Tax=Kitasatospora sp. NBC_00315 TaxID=2975963 RepID=UPI00324C3762